MVVASIREKTNNEYGISMKFADGLNHGVQIEISRKTILLSGLVNVK